MQVLGPVVTNYTSRVVTAAAFIDQTLVIQLIGWPYHWMALSECGIGRLFWRDEVFTDTRITHHNDPAWFCVRARWRAFRHAYGSFNKSVRVAAITDFAFLAKISALSSFSGNRGTKFAKISNFSLVRHFSRWGWRPFSEFATHRTTAVSDRGYSGSK